MMRIHKENRFDPFLNCISFEMVLLLLELAPLLRGVGHPSICKTSLSLSLVNQCCATFPTHPYVTSSNFPIHRFCIIAPLFLGRMYYHTAVRISLRLNPVITRQKKRVKYYWSLSPFFWLCNSITSSALYAVPNQVFFLDVMLFFLYSIVCS